MGMIDARVGSPQTERANSEALALLGAILDRVELAIDEAKERDFE